MLSVQTEMLRANKCMEQFNAAMMAFQANLMRHDREGQDSERAKMVAALESWSDQMMVVDKIASEL